MKKSGLVLALIFFAACAIVGYLVASKSSGGTSTTSAGSVNVATAMASPQQNYLLVQVDDLSKTSQKLIQAWIVLTYYSDPPQIIFLPLYPSYDSAQNSNIAGAFAMTNSGRLSEKLSKKIADLYNVKVDGYILTDAAGLTSIAGWYNISGIEAGSSPAQTDDDKHVLLLNSQTFFQNVCAQLKAGGAQNQYTSMQWSQLIPSHFQTDLSFEVLIASWDRVIRSSPPQQCDVHSSE
jgi:hypothetical protein